MAISQSDGSIILNTKVDTSGVEKGFSSIATSAKKMGATVGKAFIAIGAAATVSAVAIVKSSTDAYAEYEQLVGGVETLFKGSSARLIQYANEAYRTTGQSANEYMRNVTSFSASLLSAVGGDTEKAADIANAAMISISDNVNKMGSSAESVTMAYQGFAKQQYQLLDNLKLGYGGTKTEMERLLKDAQELTGVKYDISSLADVYTAIGVIQEKLGIAGTTAKEASTTISGSAATMRAAWKNVLTAISGGGDLERAINNLVDSISIYFENIVPVVERALSGIGRLIEKVAPMLVQTVAKSLIRAVPSLLNAVYEMIIGLSKGIYQGIIDLFNGTSRDVLIEQADNIEKSVENQNELTKAVEETNEASKRTLAGFDDIQILSSEMADGFGENTFATESVSVDFGGMVGMEESKRELSDFEKSLKKSFDNISKMIKKAWDSKPVQSFWKSVKSYGGFLWRYWSTLGLNLRENLKSVWQDIEDDFRAMTSNMGEFWTSFFDGFQIGIDDWGQPIINGVNAVFDSIWNDAVAPYINLMVGAWSDFAGILKSKWEEYGQPLIGNIGQFVNNVIALFQSISDNVLGPIVIPLLETMSSLWDENISKMVGKAADFVIKLVNGALEIYNKFIHPIVTWLTEILAPIFNLVGSTIYDTFYTIIGVVSDVIGGILVSLGGLIDFITGVFTGDWEQAWDGIKSYFIGIWEAIWVAIRGTINLIIDGLNSLWRGIYWSLSSVINGVGGILQSIGDLTGNDFGWKIPTNPPVIPKLAQGAVIPPNREFLAVLGDQKNGTNIEAPLSTIQEAVQLVMNGQIEEMTALLASSIEVQREILEAVLGIEIGDDVIGNAISRYQRKMTVIHGG